MGRILLLSPGAEQPGHRLAATWDARMQCICWLWHNAGTYSFSKRIYLFGVGERQRGLPSPGSLPKMAATSKTELILSHELSWVYYVDAGAQGLELSSSTTFPGCKQGALVEVEQPGIEKIAHMGCQHFRRRISILCHHIVPYNFLSFCFLKVHLYT